MVDESVPEADGIKEGEIEAAPGRIPGSLSFGAPPTFKRKRSFWRALRRGDVWALMSYKLYYGMKNLVGNLAADMYNCSYIPKEENWIIDRHIPDDVFYLIRKNNDKL